MLGLYECNRITVRHPFFAEVVLSGLRASRRTGLVEEAWAIPDASRGPSIFL